MIDAVWPEELLVEGQKQRETTNRCWTDEIGRPNILPAPMTTVARRRYQLQLANRLTLAYFIHHLVHFGIVSCRRGLAAHWIPPSMLIFWLCLTEKARTSVLSSSLDQEIHQAEISECSCTCRRVNHETDFTSLLTADRRVRHRRGGRRDDSAGRGEEHRGVWLAGVGGHLVSLGVRRH